MPDPLHIEPDELRAALERGDDVQLVDVREGWEFAIARLEGAVLISLPELARRSSELDATKPTILYCHHGIRSLHAALALRSRGFENARSLRGGLDRWSAEIDATVPRY
jgi:rhodanese-related sulfurtransferase